MGATNSDSSQSVAELLCTRCKTVKPVAAFRPARAFPSRGYDYNCNDCKHQRYQAQAETVRAKARAKRYGLAPERHAAMEAEQGGVCAICRRPERAVGGRRGTTVMSLAVDHDHTSGVVRGLLCSACNAGLAWFRDDEDSLASAIEYLRRARRGQGADDENK
jgi:hypothetical protein